MRKPFAPLAIPILCGLLLLAGGVSPAPGTPQVARRSPVVGLPLRPGLERARRQLGLDPLAVWRGVLYVQAGAAERRRLAAAGLTTIQAAGFYPALPHDATESVGGPNGAYHSYAEMEADLADLAARYPDLASLTTIGTSLEGRRLSALKISDNPGLEEDEPGVLLAGGHHAREWISVEVPFQMAKRLLEGYGSDPDIRALVDGCQVWIVPMVNPDGLEYSIRAYRYWRKNRRDNGDGTFGVDLNRNYACQWGADDVGSSPDTGSETYRGPRAFSEPETDALRGLAAAHGFSSAVFFHSYGQTILYPWSWTSDPAPDRDALEALSRDLSGLIAAVEGRVYAYGQSGVALYVSNGDAGDWVYDRFGAPALTIELPPSDLLYGGFLNAETDIASISAENWPAVTDLLRRAIRDFRPGRSGPGQPLPAAPVHPQIR